MAWVDAGGVAIRREVAGDGYKSKWSRDDRVGDGKREGVKWGGGGEGCVCVWG